MLLTTLFATAAIASGPIQTPALNCPITLEPVVKGSKVTDWNGVRFSYCCPGCDTQFEKNPQAALDKAAKAGKTIGVFLFDPVSQMPIDAKKAKGGFSDYKGVRFYFATAAEKKTFDATPAKLAAIPKKEALFCPINKAAVASYDKASGYGDFEGVRYYFCCAGCEKPFGEEPAKYAPFAKDYVKASVAKTIAPKEGN